MSDFGVNLLTLFSKLDPSRALGRYSFQQWNGLAYENRWPNFLWKSFVRLTVGQCTKYSHFDKQVFLGKGELNMGWKDNKAWTERERERLEERMRERKDNEEDGERECEKERETSSIVRDEKEWKRNEKDIERGKRETQVIGM